MTEDNERLLIDEHGVLRLDVMERNAARIALLAVEAAGIKQRVYDVVATELCAYSPQERDRLAVMVLVELLSGSSGDAFLAIVQACPQALSDLRQAAGEDKGEVTP